jgi:hypothetical protein
MTIPVEPNLDHPIPESLKAHSAETLSDHVRVMGNTALLLNELGDDETFDMTDDDAKQAADMIKSLQVDGGDQTKGTKNKDLKAREETKKPGVALALGYFVGHYDQQVIQDKVQLRNISVNTLLEILEKSDDEKNRLKAAELIGKAGDLFTDKAEITITHKTSDELKNALRQRIELLMQMQQNRPPTMAEKGMGEILDVEVKEKHDDSTES